MLKLKEIYLYNFKSYKGKHKIGPFCDKFTAIVGPNGCGKSNLLDAILFGLGYSAKKLRHTNLKDTIYKGESEMEVRLLFQNHHENIILSRKVYITGQSKYYIKELLNDININIILENIKLVSIKEKDFCLYLKNKNIKTQFNRFLILQGEIESISLMNSIELLNYIEDCIGTGDYKEKIELLTSELNTINEQLLIKQNEHKFILNELNFKKTQCQSYLKELQQNMEYFQLIKDIFELDQIIIEKEKIQLNEELKNIELESNNILNNKSKLCIELDKLNNTNNPALESVKKKYIEYKKEQEIIASNIRDNEKKKNKIQKQIEEYQNKIKEIEIKKQNSKQFLNEYENNLVTIKQLMQTKLDKEMYINTWKNTNKEVIIKEINKKKLEEELYELSKYVDTEMKLIQKKKYYESELNNFKNIEIPKINIKTLEDEIKQLECDASKLKIILNKNTKCNENNNIKNRINIEQQKVIDEIKNISGFIGILRDLGEIDAEYLIALENATSQLNSIVVTTTSVAEEAIQIIMKKKLMRTTFIILDKIIKAPKNNNQLLLRNKIRTKYEDCFYFALKDTFVVDTLEIAKKYAYSIPRKRVVTKDGKLIEPSGIMTGKRSENKHEHILVDVQTKYEKITTLLQQKYEERKKIYEFLSKSQEMKIIQKKYSELKNIKIDSTLDTKYARINEIKNELVNYDNIFPNEIVKLNNEINELNIIIKEKENKSIQLQLAISEINELSESTFINKIIELNNMLKNIVYIDNPNIKIYEKIESKYNELLNLHMIKISQYDKKKKKLDNLCQKEIEIKFRKQEIELQLNELVNKMTKNEIDNANLNITNIQNEIKTVEKILDKESNTKAIYTNKNLINSTRKMTLQKLKEYNNIKKNEIKKIQHKPIEFNTNLINEFIVLKQKNEQITNEEEKIVDNKIKKLNKINHYKDCRNNEFMHAFNIINKNITQIFNNLTFGGNAELEFVNFLDPFTEGILLQIMPKKKTWKPISNLSGGEKTLASLSLIFALHQYNPSSFYIMDEIDAALDYKNVLLISNYIKQVNSQFIVISFKNDMFEMAKLLIGVYKTKNHSNVITYLTHTE